VIIAGFPSRDSEVDMVIWSRIGGPRNRGSSVERLFGCDWYQRETDIRFRLQACSQWDFACYRNWRCLWRTYILHCWKTCESVCQYRRYVWKTYSRNVLQHCRDMACMKWEWR